MGDVSFAVEARDTRGKGAARELRRNGMVPAVVYGGGREATAIQIDSAKFERMLETSHAGVNTLIDLEGSEAGGKTVIAKELQREAVRGKLIHVDFYEVDLSTKIEVSVPIRLTGTPEGVVLGGVLDQQMRDVTLMCLPNTIPDSVDIDVSGMELGDSLHVSDLGVADGVDIATESELTVATVLIPRGLRDSANADGDESGDEGADDASGEGDEGGEG
ncbi:MAG: 50S ribosomal protein L25 [Deltaproteobacteria bacterium]|nr:50S ribosomal protein L25 [Deltaproteobacteria bacterium]